MRIRKIDHNMNNTKLIAKFSEADMVATEAKYHHTCLNLFYNQYRKFNSERPREMAELELIKGIALSELFAFIEESVASSPVFLLKDLKQFYQDRLQVNNASEEEAKCVHSTRLKLKIPDHIPGLCKSMEKI